MRYAILLREHRRRRGLTQDELAEAMGVEQPTVQRWESGKRKLDAEQISQLADVLGVAPGELFSAPQIMPVGPRLFVKGAVAAGVWREAAQWPEDEWQAFNGRADVLAPIEMRFGLRVEGDSMNEVYPHGTIIECVSFLVAEDEIRSGKRVVVLRRREDLEYEATVKEFYTDDEGQHWLLPRSTNPAFRPIRIGDEEPGIIETQIIAVVKGSYRPE